MITELIRNKVFWLIDRVKGSPVKKHLLDIERKMKYKKQDDYQLKKILDYAVSQVEFYNQAQGYKCVRDFPIINKNIIKNNYEKFKSKNINTYDTIPMSTSGSTGVPFTILQDKNKRDRCLAEMMYFWNLSNYDVGNKYIFYRSWNKTNKKSWISAFSRNVIMHNTLNLDKASLEKEMNFLKNNKQIKNLIGYASTLEILGNYMFQQNCTPDMFNVKGIIAISESLSDKAKIELESVFGCVVTSHYSNSESGVIGQFDEDKQGFTLNRASLFIEVLNPQTLMPVKHGESGKVIITDLYNKAMPLIRYDTGDIGKLEMYGDEYILKRIEGREIDFITSTDRKLISPHDISVGFWGMNEIEQYQFIQEDDMNYTVKLCTHPNFSGESMLLKRFKTLLGNDAKITIEYVTDIEALSSGKRKYIVNNKG